MTSKQSLNLGQMSRPYNNQQKKKKWQIVDSAVLADHQVTFLKSEKNKYLDLTRELNKLRKMKVTIIPIMIGVLGTVTK